MEMLVFLTNFRGQAMASIDYIIICYRYHVFLIKNNENEIVWIVEEKCT